MLKGRGKYLILASYVIFDYLVDALFQKNFETKETIGKQLLLLVAVFGLAKVFYRAGMQMSLFLTITFVSLKDLSSFISTTIIMCSDKLFDLWIVLLEKGYMSAGTVDIVISWTASVLQLVMIIVYSVLFYKSLKMVVKNYKSKGPAF